MKIYVGIDLHSDNSYVVIIDEEAKVIYQKRLTNDIDLILQKLSPYQEKIDGIVIESTYNWYWLVDRLREASYPVHLANTAAIKQYSGIKHTDDNYDAWWLANLLRLKLLEEGYIYPKEERGMRELVRRGLVLVRQQTMNILRIQGIITRYENVRLTGRKIKRLSLDKEVINKVIHLVLGINLEGEKELLSMWCNVTEDAKFWLSVLTELKNRKVQDVLIYCCDGLTSFPAAITPASIS